MSCIHHSRSVVVKDDRVRFEREGYDVFMPCLIESGELPVSLGHPLVDAYLEFVAGRSRVNTLWAVAYDLKVFFEVVAKDVVEVEAADVFAFVGEQRGGAERRVVRLVDGEAGLALSTIRRRLSSVSGLYAYLVIRGDVEANPVPRGLPTRRGNDPTPRVTPLVRAPRKLPKILEPEEVNRLWEGVHTARDRAMIDAMVLGGLRRCEVLGLGLGDLDAGAHRVFVAEGKGGHQRYVPIADRFFVNVGVYLDGERPNDCGSDRVFVVGKGPNRGQPLSANGLDDILRKARGRAGLDHGSCHELRHTCLTRLREAGMALEAIQAQAGHRSIESTRIYLHLGDGWLADEYAKVADALAAQTQPAGETTQKRPR